MDILEMVVQMQPILDHLGEVGHPLLLKYEPYFLCLLVADRWSCRFMSTQIGFQYLYNADYIDREMDGWFHVSSEVIGVMLSTY